MEQLLRLRQNKCLYSLDFAGVDITPPSITTQMLQAATAHIRQSLLQILQIITERTHSRKQMPILFTAPKIMQVVLIQAMIFYFNLPASGGKLAQYYLKPRIFR
jgi:hypothetical protein